MNIKLQSKLRCEKNRGVVIAVMMISLILFSPITSSASSDTKVADIATLMQQKTVTLNINEKPIRFILNEIKKQTGIGFIIQDSKTESDLEKLSITVNKMSVEEVLKALLKNTGYRYRVENNVIMLDKVVLEVTAKFTQGKFPVSGNVLDAETRKPIAGSTIIIQGTPNGAITDEKGKFTLNVSKDDILEISFLGMISQNIIVKDSKAITVLLKSDAMVMDDVVVTGYGDVKRSSYTGNAVTVNKEQLLKASKTNVIKALQSFDPSFRIKENNQWGSDPNSLPEVYIRGESGIGVKQMDKDQLSKSNLQDNPNLPTFIMDGFEISVQKLYDYDPNRIESITILKDAAATALYGSRAANGVVIITTVAPKSGKVNISYNFTGDIKFPDLSDYDLLNAAEKLEVERLAGAYSPELAGNRGEAALNQEYNLKLANVKRGVDTYWLSQPVKTVFNHKHSLYIDGGSENLRFGFDVNYTNEDGVMKGSLRDRLTAGFYINYQYKTLSVKNYITYSQAKSNESPYGNFQNYATALPYSEFKDANGNYVDKLQRYYPNLVPADNPLYESGLANFDRSLSEDIINNLSINWNITKDLLLKAQMSLTKDMGKTERFLDPLSNQNKNVLSLNNQSSGELTNGISNGFTIDATVTLSYNKTIGKNNINLLAGTNLKDETSSRSSEYFEGFPSGVLSSPNYAQKSPNKPTYSESTRRLAGFMASLNYSFDNIYLLDASMRFDGSSAFGSEKRFAPFWSFGAGVNIHNYKFLQDIKVINHLKIRGSYGQTGKANFPAYTARTTYVALTDEWYKTGYGAILQGYGNKNLTWETTNTFDIGGEIGLFNNLVFVKGSYYHKKTIDLINDVTIRSSTGFNQYKDNIGEILNEGYEFDARVSVLRTKNSNLIINANLAHNKNTILKISESLKAYNNSILKEFRENGTGVDAVVTPYLQYTEGGSLSSIWGAKSQGINPATGEEVYVTPGGALINEWVEGNQQIIGNTDPMGQGSIGLNYSYKNLNVYVSFMYEFGGQRYNQTLVDKVENANVYYDNVDKRVLTERWSKAGDIAKYKSLVSGRDNTVNTRPTSRFVQDYSVLSLSSLNISYDISQKWLKPVGLSMLRVEVGTNDLFHISTVKQERGISYPFARSVNFSFKATF